MGAVTAKPVNGAEGPAALVTVTVRNPKPASRSIATVTGSVVAVPPSPIVAVTPAPLKVTAVAPDRPVPEIVAVIELPWTPLDGEITVTVGRLAVMAGTTTHSENSEVPCMASVVVAVMKCPTTIGSKACVENVMLPLESVVT